MRLLFCYQTKLQPANLRPCPAVALPASGSTNRHLCIGKLVPRLSSACVCIHANESTSAIIALIIIPQRWYGSKHMFIHTYVCMYVMYDVTQVHCVGTMAVITKDRQNV